MRHLSRLRRTAAGVTILVMALSACGTNVSDERIVEAARGSSVAAGDTAPASAGAVTGAVPDSTQVGGAAVTSPGVVPAAPGGVASSAPAASGGQAGASKAGGGKAAPAQVSGNAACTSSLAPIVIGQVGEFSGFAGQTTRGARTGAAVWAQEVNAAGGLQCHPIRLYQVDNGSDPTRTAAAVTDLVTSKKAVALFAAAVPIVAPSYRSAVEKYKIPTIGGDGAGLEWSESPYMFPQGSDPITVYQGSAAQMAAQTKFTKMGVLYCVEAQVCPVINKAVSDPQAQARGGYQVIATKTVSLTQTDYTAECQNMKSAGAQMIWAVLEGASDQRLGRSCAAIGYFPAIASSSIAISGGLVQDENLNKMGVYIGTPVVPFVQKELPAVKTIYDAYGKYAPGEQFDGPGMLAYSSGRLVEAALKAVPEARTQPVDTALILKGLYSLKNETLGGLSPGVTYVQGKPTPRVTCYYLLKLSGGSFSAPNGSKKSCL